MLMASGEVDLLAAFRRHRAEKGDEPYLIDRGTRSYSWAEGVDLIEAIARSLAAILGGRGERVAILSNNCSAWVLADWGIMLGGHISLPLFPSMTADKVSAVFERVGPRLLFIGEAANWEAVKAVLPAGMTVVALPHIEPPEGAMSFAEFLRAGEGEEMPADVSADDLCTLILTSGTTGHPKAVMHSQQSLTNIATSFVKLTGQDRLEDIHLFCHLPLGHIGEKTVSVYQSVLTGATITFSRGPAFFLEDLRHARPTLMLAVPRLWELLLGTASEKFGLSAAQVSQLAANPDPELGRKVREFLGVDRVECAISGGAICPPYVKNCFKAFGFQISDFYGQTEILPLAYDGDGEANDSVGRAAPEFELRIAPDGEILGRGPGMALGYFRDEESTRRTFRDGWVHTGDKGRLDDAGNLFITGRVSEEFKTAKGKFVAPGPIEKRCSGIALVEQCALVGLGLTQPVILCTLSAAARAMERAEIERQLLAGTDKLNQELEKHERIAGILICGSPWTIEDGLLTHTQKIIRPKLTERFAGEIDRFDAPLSAGERGIVRWA